MNNASHPIVTTPVGRGRYVWLNKPDTKFGKSEFKTQLILKPEEAKGLIQMIQQRAVDQFGDKASEAKLGFTTDIDSGDIILKAKTQYEPKFFDSQGDMIPAKAVPDMFGGSRLALRLKLFAYNASATNFGISPQILAVQVVEAVSSGGGGDDSSGTGFAPVEGGFVSDTETFNQTPSTSTIETPFGEATFID